jgi:hypothetical protein
MRSWEFLTEEESPYQQGYQAVNKLMNPTQLVSKSPEYQRGYQAVNKLMSPSTWFDKSQKSAQPAQKKLPSHEIRNTLVNVSSGQKLYRQDIDNLKTIYAMVDDGSIKVNDRKVVLDTLKSAYSGRSLSKEQTEILATLSKRF